MDQRSGTDVLTNQGQLEWLARISPNYRREVAERERSEIREAHHDEQSRWLSTISAQSVSETNRESVRTFVRAVAHPERAIPLAEAEWDPAKHPRRGGPPNAGWFATTGVTDAGGESTSSGKETEADAPPETGKAPSKKTRAVLAAWHPPVGHHWIPVAVVQDPQIRPFLSDEAVQYAAGAYSGPTKPPHGNVTLNSVTHPNYNKVIKEHLLKFIELNGNKKLSAAKMEAFVKLVESGRDAEGKIDDVLGSFNRGVKNQLPQGKTRLGKFDDVMAAGSKYMKNGRYRLLAAGAVLSGVIGEVVAQEVKVLEVTASSGHYQLAMHELGRGQLDKAHTLLTGHNSLYMEILTQVGPIAAGNFKKSIDNAFAKHQSRDYN